MRCRMMRAAGWQSAYEHRYEKLYAGGRGGEMWGQCKEQATRITPYQIWLNGNYQTFLVPSCPTHSRSRAYSLKGPKLPELLLRGYQWWGEGEE